MTFAADPFRVASVFPRGKVGCELRIPNSELASPRPRLNGAGGGSTVPNGWIGQSRAPSLHRYHRSSLRMDA
jgi:hypothetical protein